MSFIILNTILFFIFYSLPLHATNKKKLFNYDHPIINQLLAHHGGNLNQLINQNPNYPISAIKKELSLLTLADHTNFNPESRAKISDADLRRIQDGALFYFAQLTKLNTKGEISALDWSIFEAVKNRVTLTEAQHPQQDKGIRYLNYLDSLSNTGSVQAVNEITNALSQRSYYLQRPSETYQLLLLTQQIIEGTNDTLTESVPIEIAPKKFQQAPLALPFLQRFSQHHLFKAASKRLLKQAREYFASYSNPNFGLKDRHNDFLISFDKLVQNLENIQRPLNLNLPKTKKVMVDSESRAPHPIQIQRQAPVDRVISSISMDQDKIESKKGNLIENIITFLLTLISITIAFYALKHLR